MQKKIKIAGAGISGLTVAINLARQGFKVEVHEKCSQIGGHYKENPQLLPNWFSKGDVIEELEKCNIKINWIEKIEQVTIYLPEQKIRFLGKKIPVGYKVLRGGENSFETYLAQQARDLGVRIITNSSLETKPDIIATGFSKPITIGYGQVYKGEFEPNKVRVFLNPKQSSSIGYGYFFPHNKNIATIKISRNITEDRANLRENLKDLQKNYLAQEIKEENFLYDFGTKRSFNIPKSAIKDNSLLVGEAAGFQDELFRFGIRYAVISGYLAAKSIIEGLDYDKLWKKRFSKEFQRTAKTRKIFEDLKRKDFNNFPQGSEISMEIEKFKKIWLSKKTDFLLILYPFYKNILLKTSLASLILKII